MPAVMKILSAVTASAPAKINLSLDIVGRRADGYQLVETVMQAVTLRETAEVRLTGAPAGARPHIALELEGAPPDIPADSRNTAWKAAEVFFETMAETGGRTAAERITGGVAIRIVKRVPAGAGLAGGSADAAAVLAALNRLTGAGLDTEALCALGARVGADVPFCIRGGTALGAGTGVELTPLAPLPGCFILLAKPPGGVGTGEAYRRLDAAVLPPPGTAAVRPARERGDLDGVAGALGNAFDAAAPAEGVREIKDIMARCGALGCQMTGSGSAVFGLFADGDAAAACAAALEDGGRILHICRPDRDGARVE